MTTTAPTLTRSALTFGKSPVERADERSREKLRQAEQTAQDAAQRVEAERAAVEQRQLRVRLRAVESHDFAGQLKTCQSIFDDLFCSPALTEPNNQITLNSATAALGWIPKAQERQVALIERLKGELAEADKALADLESEK